MYTLGINAAFHVAGCLVRNGRIVAAAEEERYAVFWRLYGAVRYRVVLS
jgi:predicted NodU family carbamoyl transferase